MTSGWRKNMDGVNHNPRLSSETCLQDRRVVRKSQLSPSRRQLVEKMQDLGYGEIRQLVVIKGEPVVEPLPKIVRRHKLTSPRRRQVPPRSEDYILKEQVVNLFDDFDQMGNGVVAVIEVRDGLPCEITLE
jgi:hypothetical protein